MSGFNVLIMSTILSLGGSFFIPKEAGAQAPDGKASFNASEVVEQVSHHPRMEGERIIIQDREYEAEFKEGKAVIKARQGKPGAEDVVIPVSGRPEVRDGRVVYSSWEGETEFEGSRRGLRYRERGWMPGNTLIGKGAGNFSKLERSAPLAGEFLLDTTIVYKVAPDWQEPPSLAFDGTNYLVVWGDGRSESSSDIYGARVSPSGVVIDSAGIAISTAFNVQYSPAVAFDGTNYLVVWSDRHNDQMYADIYGARISPSGTVLDPNGIAISIEPYTQESPTVAFDGTNYLVAWDDDRNASTTWFDIYCARVTPGGVVLDPAGIKVFSAPMDQLSTSVAFDGTNYLVVWEDRRNEPSDNGDVYASRVTPAGVVLDTAGIAISTVAHEQWGPKVGFDGTNYLVAWCDYRNGSDFDIYGARVSRGGVVLDPNGIVLCNAPYYQYDPSVAFDGTNYLVSWWDYRSGSSYDIYGTRVSSGGVVLDPNGIAIAVAPNYQDMPIVFWGGTNYLVVWSDARREFYDVYGARVSPGGVVLDPSGIAITTAANRQECPAVAFDGTNYLAVWEDYRHGLNPDIYGTRVSPDGRLLDPGGIAICTDTTYQGSPSVAFDGTNYLVVWSDWRGYGDIYGARVSPSGVVLDTSGIAISTSPYYQIYPSVAFDGTNYLVAWEDHRAGYDISDIYGSRVTPGGVVLDPNGIVISTAERSQESPSVAFDGVNYLVVWQDDRTSRYYWDLFGSRVSPSGLVLDPNGIAISTAPYYQTYPSLAFDGTNYFVVWSDLRGGLDYDIYGARVSPAGIVLDTSGIPIPTAPNSQYNPSIAFDGTDYLVTWQDNRSGVDLDVYGAKLNPSGVVVDTFAVSVQPGDQLYPAVANGNGSQVFVTYHGFADSINGRPANIQRIWGKFYPLTGVEREKGISISEGMPSLRVYPNPFREKTWVSANVPGHLKVYDALGRLVRDFSPEALKRGPFDWDGADGHGLKLPGGVYFVRMEHGGTTLTKKVILLR
jgi:hypothetical protein